MPRDPELVLLRDREQSAFLRKQSAFQSYIQAKERADAAYAAMQSAWEDRSAAGNALNREFEEMSRSRAINDMAWSEYKRTRESLSSRIDSLRSEADREHSAMKDCFERASSAYQYGDKSEAPYYASEGREHKARRDELNAEVGRLIDELRSAKQSVEYRTGNSGGSGYRTAKATFDSAKATHIAAQEEFRRLKAERDRCKAEFDAAQAEFLKLKEEVRKKQDAVKKKKRDTERKMVEKVDMALVKVKPFSLGSIFGQDAKIVPRTDGSGKIDVYFAGLASAGDGLGHGHAVIDRNGNVTYLRDAWSDHKDYLINDRAPKGKPTHNI